MKFMKQMSKRYPKESIAAAENEKSWYLPHHRAYNQNKPGTIRVVFNLSAEFQGISSTSHCCLVVISLTRD